MGATRPASERCYVHTLNKGSQTAVITRLSVSLCLKFLKIPTQDEAAEKCPDAGRVAPISACVVRLRCEVASGACAVSGLLVHKVQVHSLNICLAILPAPCTF